METNSSDLGVYLDLIQKVQHFHILVQIII